MVHRRFSKHVHNKILFEKEYILWTESWESWFVFSGSSSSIGGLVALCLRICCLNSSLELLDTDTELQKIKKKTIKSDEWIRNGVEVSRFWNDAPLKHSSNCAKIKKYCRTKYVSNFLIFGAKNIVEHYGKRIEILHGCPFEGWPSRARPSHPSWQKLADWLNWLYPVKSALKRTPCMILIFFHNVLLYYDL